MRKRTRARWEFNCLCERGPKSGERGERREREGGRKRLGGKREVTWEEQG